MDVQQIYRDKEALLEGHFLLSSGLHSEVYLQSAKVLQYADIATQLGQALADKFKGISIDVVISPALGGIYVSHEVGRALKVRSLFVERVNGTFELRRGFEIKPNENILVVEDVITSGKSTHEVLKVLKDSPGNVVAVGCLVDRSTSPIDFGIPTHSLLKVEAKTYNPKDCPACAQGLPTTKPGSRSI